MTYFVREKIDELRDLLGLHDRTRVSMMQLRGVIEVTDMKPLAMIREFEDSGDVAYIFIGPKDLLRGEYRKCDDGSATFTIRIPSSP